MSSFRFDIDARALSAGLADVIRTTDKRSSIATLAGVLLESGTGRGITLRATDMEISSAVTIPAAGTVHGATVVADPKALHALVKTLTGEIGVVFDADTLALTVATGAGARFSFETIAAVDFPAAATFGEGSSGKLDTAAFLSVLEHVLPTVSKDYTRPVLTSACMSITGDRLTLTGTDSYRLAMDSMPAASGDRLKPANVPGQALRELQRIAKRKGAPALITWEITPLASHHIRFTVGSYTVSARCIDGQYPNWRKLLPETHEVQWTTAAGELAAAAKRIAATMDRKANKPIRIASTDSLEIRVSTPFVDGLGASEIVEPETVGYPPMEIGFNPDFLADALAFCGDRARIRLISPLRPAVFLNGRDASETFHLLMPIRLAD